MVFEIKKTKKQAGIAILIPDKITSKSKLVKRNVKNTSYTLKEKGSTNRIFQPQSICTPNTGNT